MKLLEKDTQMRAYIMDSLVARSGKTLSSELIGELTQEILQRMIEVHDVPLFELRDI